MAIIKQIKVFNGSTWKTGDIGAQASNVSISSAAISSVITNVESGIKYLNDNKVSKSGDSMSGNLTINANLITTGTITVNNNVWFKSTNTSIDGISNASSNLYSPGALFSGPNTDANQMGFVQGFMYSTSTDARGNGLRISGRRKVSDSWVDNSLWLGINAQGQRTVVVTSDGAWRTAIGAPPIDHSSTTTTYGIGAPSTYGHTKVINNLTTSTSANGQALNAYQGYLLSTQVNALNHGFTPTTALSAVSIASSVNKSIGQLVLPGAGTYFLIGKVKFANNATGRRAAAISTIKDYDADSPINRTLSFCHAAANGNATQASIIGYGSFSAASTVYLNVFQNSGSSLSISGGLYAYKIGI